MLNYANSVSEETPQSEAIKGTNQEMNNAGGFSFVLDVFGVLRRFLILGTEGGTYYTSEQKLTAENAKTVIEAVKVDGVKAVNMAVEVSDQGLAKSNDPAIFVLALAFAHGNEETKNLAEKSLPSICRIGTHILTFVNYVNVLTGWNRRLRRAVSAWYLGKKESNLEYQMVKYQNRSGFTHHDVLHLCHARPVSDTQSALFYWAKTGVLKESAEVGKVLEGYMKVHANKTDIPLIVQTINSNGLTWEMLPTECLKDTRVWEALLPNLGYTALLRNLGRMSSLGMLDKFSDEQKIITGKLLDPEAISKSRIHPLAILIGSKTYESGKGVKGSLTWTPNDKVVSALEDAFYAAFKNVEPTNRKMVLAIDVSGSMGWEGIAGTAIKPSEAAAAMALVTAKVETNYEILGFCEKLVDLKITEKDSLSSALAKTSKRTFGGTDCAAPMEWARSRKEKDIHGFVVYTDNETWAGPIHPSQSLKAYRQEYSPEAKLAVFGMTATKFTIADPQDLGMMDFIGLDPSAPQILSAFISGKI
jgi:60 kDa SS-A/Ro ribonucleoprotein